MGEKASKPITILFVVRNPFFSFVRFLFFYFFLSSSLFLQILERNFSYISSWGVEILYLLSGFPFFLLLRASFWKTECSYLQLPCSISLHFSFEIVKMESLISVVRRHMQQINIFSYLKESEYIFI